MFFGYGFVMASSYSRMPGIRDQLNCTPTQLAFRAGLHGRRIHPRHALCGAAGGPLFLAGDQPVLRVAGVLACIGVVALCLINSTPIAMLGASAWGLGLSVVFPAAISAAGEIPNRGSQAIATVATIGYGGFLLGAPLIGFLAHSMPLDKALLAVAVIVLLIAILASAARERGITPRPVSNLISSHGSS